MAMRMLLGVTTSTKVSLHKEQLLSLNKRSLFHPASPVASLCKLQVSLLGARLDLDHFSMLVGDLVFHQTIPDPHNHMELPNHHRMTFQHQLMTRRMVFVRDQKRKVKALAADSSRPFMK